MKHPTATHWTIEGSYDLTKPKPKRSCLGMDEKNINAKAMAGFTTPSTSVVRRQPLFASWFKLASLTAPHYLWMNKQKSWCRPMATPKMSVDTLCCCCWFDRGKREESEMRIRINPGYPSLHWQSQLVLYCVKCYCVFLMPRPRTSEPHIWGGRFTIWTKYCRRHSTTIEFRTSCRHQMLHRCPTGKPTNLKSKT